VGFWLRAACLDHLLPLLYEEWANNG